MALGLLEARVLIEVADMLVTPCGLQTPCVNRDAPHNPRKHRRYRPHVTGERTRVWRSEFIHLQGHSLKVAEPGF